MKKRKINKIDRKALLKDINAEVSLILSRNNAKASLAVAYVFTVSMAGVGLICSYLLLNVLDYCTVEFTDFIGLLVSLAFIFLFSAPAFASVRNTASAVCDGREVTLPEIFAVFTSFKKIVLSYLPIRIFSWFPKCRKGKRFWIDLIGASRARMRYSSIKEFVVNILLSVVTCFIYYILVAGPRAAVRRELITRKINNINSKNNERTVKRND